MPARELAIVIDAADVDALRDFWVAATGYEPHGSAGPYRSATPPDGGPGPKLVFQHVPEAQTADKNRLHLDIVVGDEVASEADRLERTRRDPVERPRRGGRHLVDRDGRSRGQRVLRGRDHVSGEPTALDDLRSARTSDGAPSARNLIVTVFGDALLPHGADTEISVGSLAGLLEPFGVNERLVRTSLTRLTNDGLLAVRAVGRRSFYRVAPDALGLFADADDRIYRGATATWDGSWTIVVIDGAESTAAHRARLRQELGWAGLGVVAPNVMASPIVPAATAAAIVERIGVLHNVLVSRSEVVEAGGTLGGDELARRCVDLDAASERYRAFVERFGRFDEAVATELDPAGAFKLRVLLVSSFRRLAVTDPSVPAELLPDPWPGAESRVVLERIYRSIAGRSEAFLHESIEPLPDDWAPAPVAERFAAAVRP